MSERALVANAADTEQVKSAGQREKLNRQQEIKDIATILGLREGRRFMWRLLTEAGIYKTSFHPSGSVVYFNEGRREFGLKFLADVEEADPSAHQTMAQEARSDERKHG